MAVRARPIHICDDWIHIPLPDRDLIAAAQKILFASDHWTEIVPGLDSIAVQFDPALTLPADAADMVRNDLDHATPADTGSRTMMTIPVCYEGELAPDRAYVAEKLGIAEDALPAWHASRPQRVSMLGFTPGFAYLESTEPCPAVGRLTNPRQLVKAGSIGIIGQQSCIYSFDSPGGWPIIGRTPLHLFDAAKAQPALLSAGQTVSFQPISREAFENWPRAVKK